MTDSQLETAKRIASQLSDGQGAAARAGVESLLASCPGEVDVQALAGDVYASVGEHSLSYRCYQFAADIYNRANQQDKVLQVQHKILALNPAGLDANAQARMGLLKLLVVGEDALLEKQFEKAVASFQEAIRQFPNHTVTYQRLAVVLAEMGRVSEAVEQYLTVARAFYSHGIISKALPYFEKALELDPVHPEALEAFLICLAREGREGEVENPLKAAAQRCLELGINDKAWLFFARLSLETQKELTQFRAALLLQRNDIEQAQALANQALAAGKAGVAEWFERMGKAALDRGDAAAAQVYAQWAAQAQPVVAAVELLEVHGLDSVQSLIGDSKALQEAGELCLKEEMFEEAKQVFERLLSAEPQRKDLLELLNQARAGLGLIEMAVSENQIPAAPAVAVPAATPPKPMLVTPAPAPAIVVPVAAPPKPVFVVPTPAPATAAAAAVNVNAPPKPAIAAVTPPPLPPLKAVTPPVALPPLPPLQKSTLPAFPSVPKPLLKTPTGPAIVRTQYEMHLGELLPPSASAADLDEQLIG